MDASRPGRILLPSPQAADFLSEPATDAVHYAQGVHRKVLAMSLQRAEPGAFSSLTLPLELDSWLSNQLKSKASLSLYLMKNEFLTVSGALCLVSIHAAVWPKLAHGPLHGMWQA